MFTDLALFCHIIVYFGATLVPFFQYTFRKPVCVPFSALLVYSATPHLSKHNKPDDYLAMSSPDIVGLCFPEFSNPGKSSTATVCALSKRNMKGGCSFKVSPRSTGRLTHTHICFHLCFPCQLKLQLLGVNYWMVLSQRTLKMVDYRSFSCSLMQTNPEFFLVSPSCWMQGWIDLRLGQHLCLLSNKTYICDCVLVIQYSPAVHFTIGILKGLLK